MSTEVAGSMRAIAVTLAEQGIDPMAGIHDESCGCPRCDAVRWAWWWCDFPHEAEAALLRRLT